MQGPFLSNVIVPSSYRTTWHRISIQTQHGIIQSSLHCFIHSTDHVFKHAPTHLKQPPSLRLNLPRPSSLQHNTISTMHTSAYQQIKHTFCPSLPVAFMKAPETLSPKVILRRCLRGVTVVPVAWLWL